MIALIYEVIDKDSILYGYSGTEAFNLNPIYASIPMTIATPVNTSDHPPRLTHLFRRLVVCYKHLKFVKATNVPSDSSVSLM